MQFSHWHRVFRGYSYLNHMPLAFALIFAIGQIGFTSYAYAQGAVPADQPQQQAQAARPARIDRNGILILVRSVILALDQANKTGNYTVLRDLGAPAFQANSAARLGEIFVRQRNEKYDLSSVAVLEPQLTIAPQIEGDGSLHMAGFFPSIPSQINFDLYYAAVAGQWRVVGLSVGVAASTPVAAPTPDATDAAPAGNADVSGQPQEQNDAQQQPSPTKTKPSTKAKPVVRQ